MIFDTSEENKFINDFRRSQEERVLGKNVMFTRICAVENDGMNEH